MEIRDCFRGSYGDHLKIIVSDPAKDPDNLLIVSVTTFREGKFHDPSCFLSPGDHPFIKHESYIGFQFAKIRSNADLDRLLGSGGIILEDDQISEAVLERIHHGASVSEFIALEYADLLREQEFIE
jgi:hypothetical protein